MELRHLRYFVTVAETLHFGRAAERLHIAQPALSIQIRALERQLGGELFARGTRRVALTEAGRLFLREARRTLAQAEHAVEVAQEALSGELGCLNIGYSGSAAYSGVLRRHVQAFRRRHPRVEISLQELDPLRQLAALQQRTLRVGFLTTLALPVPQDVEVFTLARWSMCVALADAHPLAGRAALSADDLLDEAFISYAGEDEPGARDVMHALLGHVPARSYGAANLMMVLTLAGAGLGVALLPASLAGLGPACGVTFRPYVGRGLEMDCSLASLRGEREPVVQAFVEMVMTGT
jgi:DNA-binding transcriptional LysR family regulator